MAEKRGKAALFSDEEFNIEEPVNVTLPEDEEQSQEVTHNADTQTYTMTKEETRSKRIQIVIKPSVNKALDRLVRQKKIKSKNDLVNFLLESYIEKNKA